MAAEIRSFPVISDSETQTPLDSKVYLPALETFHSESYMHTVVKMKIGQKFKKLITKLFSSYSLDTLHQIPVSVNE